MDVCSVLTVSRQPSQTAFLLANQQAICLLEFTKNYRQKDRILPSHKTNLKKVHFQSITKYATFPQKEKKLDQSYRLKSGLSLSDGNMILLRKSNRFGAKTGVMIKIGLCIWPLCSFSRSRHVLPAGKTAVDSLTAIYHPQVHGKYSGLV